MKLLITGAAGYIGRYLTWKLEDRHELVLADAFPPDDSRIPWIFEPLGLDRKPEYIPKPSNNHPFHVGDALDMDYLRRITEGVEAVIHLTGNRDANDHPITCYEVNALGVFKMLLACEEHGIRKALVASSINAAGWFYCRVTDRPRNWPYLPVDEDIPPDHEDSYSLAKYCCELNCQAWTNRTGMTTAAFRFAGVFPPEWTESYKNVAKPTQEWPGELGNYVDLRDVVGGLVKAVECETLPAFGVYQLVAPDTTLPEPTLEIIERFRPELLKVVREPMPGRTTMLSNKRAMDAFGYDPQHHWKDI
jgi:nucleoside-diphosphate-sugar epimerase